MGILSLQVLSLMATKTSNCRDDIWPAKFHGLQDFTAVERITDVPNVAARIVLSVLHPDTACVGGGYAAYKCGLTSEHGDVDVFIGVRPGDGLKSAKEILKYLSCV